MRYLTIAQVLELHRRVLEQSGGIAGLRDRAGLESAVAQPWMTFGGADLYPTLAAKAGAMCHALVQNHPFNDGNKRVGHAPTLRSTTASSAGGAESLASPQLRGSCLGQPRSAIRRRRPLSRSTSTDCASWQGGARPASPLQRLARVSC